MPRPFTTAIVAMSLDGKIATRDRDDTAFSSRADRRFLNEKRAQSDALVVGAGTVRAGDPPMRVSPRSLLKDRPEPLRAVVSRLCLLSPDLMVFGPGSKTLVFTCEDASPGARKALSGAAEVRVSKGSVVRAAEVLEALGALGAKRVLVEGGGELIWAFLEEDLLDEIHVTLCPVAIGGQTAPTPAGGAGFDAASLKRAKLIDVRREGDELFLHYSFRS
ncbi:MAG: dihydrofolate reductase family protein [Planctomycetota bacterium]